VRVIHVVPSLDVDTGGPARAIPNLCKALQESGVDAAVCSFRRAGGITTVEEQEDLPIHWYKPLFRTRQVPTWKFYSEFSKIATRFELAHLHSIWNPVITVAGFVCRRIGIPYILSPMGMLQEVALRRRRWAKSIYYVATERWTLRGARRLHFLTTAEAADSKRLAPSATPQIIVPNGVDPALGSRVRPGGFRKRHAVLRGRRLMLFLGRLHWSKGLELQLHALDLLQERFPDLVWILVGPDEGAWAGLRREVRRRRLEDRVLWLGSLAWEECLDALADADVFVLTSRHEAHSVALNEALAVGAPVVITRTGSADEVAEAGAGHVVTWTPEEVAAAVADVLSHPTEAMAMREAGRRLVLTNLAWSHVADSLVRVYQQMLSES
jgi:glycosyltransferase involved in cell wall biosynthesis